MGRIILGQMCVGVGIAKIVNSDDLDFICAPGFVYSAQDISSDIIRQVLIHQIQNRCFQFLCSQAEVFENITGRGRFAEIIDT